jgi:acetylornithine deacetylase
VNNWPAHETAWEHPLVGATVRARDSVLGVALPPPSPGAPVNFGAASDASFFQAAGIPAVVFGPGDLKVAHSRDESVSLDEVVLAAQALAATVVEWCGVAA